MLTFLEYLALACVPAFLLLDLIHGERKYDTPRFWRLRGFLVCVLTLALSMTVAIFWGTVLDGVALFDGSGLGTVGGALAGILVYELVHYWYHRSIHRFDFLWRAAHQMHHSAESIDAFGAYYMHPLDTFLFTTWSSLVFFPLLGLTPMAGAIGAVFLTFNAMFQHANIKTPHWLGYIIQRPESHCIHHGRGIHRYNFSDLPLWDIVFGTFRNPRCVEGLEAGFYTGASSRIGDMLIGKDVSEPEAAAKPPATAEAA